MFYIEFDQFYDKIAWKFIWGIDSILYSNSVTNKLMMKSLYPFKFFSFIQHFDVILWSI